jgi:excisionase family DNA binding protein
MAKKNPPLTATEFAKKAGISASKVTQLIRDGKIKAEKKGNKWMIAPDQLKPEIGKKPSKPRKPAAKKKATAALQKKSSVSDSKKKTTAAKPATGKSFSVKAFAEMTYLTEHGISEWLQIRRLKGRQNNSGEWQVDASNQETPDIKRLLR